MEAKELMIGNLIQHFEYMTTVETIKKDVNGQYYIGGHSGHTSIFNVIGAFKPIQLTPELLLNLGFKYRNEYRGDGALFDLEDSDWKKGFCVAKLNGKEGFCSLATGRQQLMFVHQLQNLFYVETWTELKRIE